MAAYCITFTSESATLQSAFDELSADIKETLSAGEKIRRVTYPSNMPSAQVLHLRRLAPGAEFRVGCALAL